MIQIIYNDIVFKLGKNAQDNFDLIDEANDINDNYWWFHLDDYPSGHCIIFSEIIDKQMIIVASELVKQNSKLKNSKNVKVIYTQLKNIVKTKTKGEVKILQKPKIINI